MRWYYFVFSLLFFLSFVIATVLVVAGILSLIYKGNLLQVIYITIGALFIVMGILEIVITVRKKK